MVIHSTFPDFLLFLYVHIAKCDNTYDPLEIAVIKDRMTRWFPEGTDMERKIYLAIREYNSFDSSHIGELLHDSLVHFKGDEETRKTKLFSDIEAIIMADGIIVPNEKNTYDIIRRIVSHA